MSLTSMPIPPVPEEPARVAIATAMNVVQLTSWLRGEAPEQTRTSHFKQVMKQAI